MLCKMQCAKYIFVSSIDDGADGLQLEQFGDRRISVPGFLGSMDLSWKIEGLEISMDNASCYVRFGEDLILCDSSFMLPWNVEGPIYMLQTDTKLPFARVRITKIDDVALWERYKPSIMHEEDRLLSDIYEHEYHFWQNLSSHGDLQEPSAHLNELLDKLTDLHGSLATRSVGASILLHMKQLQFKYSVKLLNMSIHKDLVLDKIARKIRSVLAEI